MSSPSPALRFTISISICPMPAAFISKSLDAICCLCGIRLKCSANQCNLTVNHYYLENQSPLYTIHLLNTFWNFFHKPWFFPYSVTTVSPTFLPSTSLLSMDIDFKDGKKKSYLLLPKESDNLIAIPMPSDHQSISSLLFSEKADIRPMKTSTITNRIIFRYLNYIKDLEYNTQIFRIKADFGA